MNVAISYRFGDSYWITDFITPANPDIEAIKKTLYVDNNDETVERIAGYIRDAYQYPLDNRGNPATDAQILRYRKGLFLPSYRWRACKFYVWSFPPETIQSKLGFCAETANLACSFFLPKIPALVCLGEVRTAKEDTLLGYHSWLESPYKDELYLQETTIHVSDVFTLVTTKSAYDRNSDWAKQGNLYYIVKARYNKDSFEGDASVVTKMSLPAKRLMLFSLNETLKVHKKRLYKEWKAEQKIIHSLIKEAWHGRQATPKE